MHLINHWQSYAHHWNKLSSPLRPHPDDIRIYARELSTDKKTLLLGVTPEIPGLKLTGVAVDRNAEMIDHVWPKPAGWEVMLASWLKLPLSDQSVNQIIGDGAMTMMRFPDEYSMLLDELRRVLHPRGKIVLRLFTLPERLETPADVRSELAAGRISSFHAFKWRLAMSLAPFSKGEVLAREVLGTFNRMYPDRLALLESTGWPAETLDTIDVYKHSTNTLSFPSLKQMHGLFSSYFDQIRYEYGSYELSECCPIVILEGWKE